MTRPGRRATRRRLAALGAVASLTFVYMTFSPRPLGREAPLVVLSVDRTLWHRLGISRVTYSRALRRAGARVRRHDYGSPVLPGETTVTSSTPAARILAGAHALVLAAGGDVDPGLYGAAESAAALEVRPARDRFELDLLEEARRRRLPVLAICRGAQLLNVSLGGTLRDLRAEPITRRRHVRLRGHAVRIEPSSRLAGILGTDHLRRVVTLHGQAVGEPGDDVRVAARAVDGEIEAIEVEGDPWTFGVQWHPELSQWTGPHRRLFRALVDAARRVEATTP